MTSSETKPLSVEEVRALLVRAVEEKGAHYVYDPPRAYWLSEDDSTSGISACAYFNNGAPSCIVGHVFSYLGFGPQDVTEGDNAYAEVHRLLENGDPTSEDRGVIVNALQAAQSAQDRGFSWGVALAAFDKTVAEMSS